MAGEIEDPISFQDCLPTGSISFGRFEAESLSWERRSSFSHNRYLEEVKKYSRPGSVIEKKAYFEAHFRRKALLREASSDCQNGVENQTTENDILDDMNYMGEFEDHGNDETFYSHSDETPTGSDEHDYVVIEFEREAEESSPCEFQNNPIFTNANTVLDDIQELDPGEILQTQFGCGTLPLGDTGTKVDIEQKPVNNAENSKLEEQHKLSDQTENSRTQVELTLANEAESADGLHIRTDLSLRSPMYGMDYTPSMKKQQNISLNVKSTTEQKTIKTKVQTLLPVALNSRNISNEKASLSKAFDKTPRKMQKESSSSTKTERRSPLKFPPTMCSLRKNLKPQDSENVEKLHQENKSGKELKSKKVSCNPQTTCEKGQSEGCESTSRPKRVPSSHKPESKLNGVIFNFKSDERAEKRKEFYMKLEEKMHAKEAEMNQIQARTQEESEAQIKQFRRSLNFKATPMPSFYLEAVSRSSDEKKAVINRAKSPKANNKSTSPANRANAQHNSPASSKAENQQGSSCEPQIQEVAECPAACITDASSHTLINGSDKIGELETRNQASQAGKKTEAGKKERERGKSSSSIVHQQQGDSHMTRKGERAKTVRPDVGKKTIKGLIGRSSEMGRLTVHVAS